MIPLPTPLGPDEKGLVEDFSEWLREGQPTLDEFMRRGLYHMVQSYFVAVNMRAAEVHDQLVEAEKKFFANASWN